MSYFALGISEHYFVSSSRSAAYVLGGEESVEGQGTVRSRADLLSSSESVTALATKAPTCPSADLLISDSHCSGSVLLEGLCLGLPKNCSELLF